MRRFVYGILALVALPCAVPTAAASGGRAAPADTFALSLEESVRLALENNKVLMVAREKVSEARAGVGEARTAFLPQLTGSALYTRLDVAPYIPTSRLAMFAGEGTALGDGAVPDKITIGLRDNYSTFLKLQQPLFAGGKIKNTYDIALLAQRATESELDRMKSELIFEVKRAYLSCVKARTLETLSEESVKQLEAHLMDIQAMYDAGLAATNDILKTKVYCSRSKLLLMKAQHGVHLEVKSFCDIVDLPLSSEIVFTSRADSVEATGIDLDAAALSGVERRSELRSMEYRKMMTKEEIETDRNGYLPDVSFFANLGYQYPDREYARDFYSTWTMGIAAQMNVFDWGRTAYRTRQSKSRLKQLEVAQKRMKDAVTLDVTRTYLTLLESWSEIEVARENVSQADENYRVTHERFKEGLATNTELLDAQVLLTNAKTTHASALVDYLIAQADLARSTGDAAICRTGP